MTETIGDYPPPPPGAPLLRVGVPTFEITAAGVKNGRMDVLAADQLTTIAFLSRRFDVVERARIEQILEEQNREGIVRAGELARQGDVRGLDLLFLGKVTNFRIKQEKVGRDVKLSSIPFLRGLGGGIGGGEIRVKVECGVDLRLVDPSTGSIVASHFGEFERVDSAKALGFALGGLSSSSEVELEVTEEDSGQVLRLALDEAVRKILPQIDALLARAARERSTEVAVASLSPGNLENAPLAAAPSCSTCGKGLAPLGRFCGSCGAEVKR